VSAPVTPDATPAVAPALGALPRLPHERRPVSGLQVFGALMMRDVRVIRREFVSFLVRTTMQPLLFIVVFGYLLMKMGFLVPGYSASLLPGILGVTLALSSMQSMVLPMVADFGWTREIEDRLLAPVPIWIVAFQKTAAAMIQGLISAAFVLPAARLIMGPIPGLTVSHAAEVTLVCLLGSATFSTLGLLMGTAVQPQQIGLMFSVILTPMFFFGCAYYPWAGLDVVPALKYAVLVNPLVYVAEGMRAVLTPGLPHMRLDVVLIALAGMTVLFWMTGIRSFRKRALG
jgi:ABC-2 type transport system permease protein